MSGWFAVKRGITSHPIFKGHPERLAIWLWLLDNAVWKDTPHDVRGKTVMVRRGSVCASERRIAEEVGVGRQVVRTFLARLKTEHMINPDATHGRSVITLCNYEKYQTSKEPANPAPNPKLTQDQPTKEQGNNIPPTEGASAPTLRKQIFDRGKALIGGKNPGGVLNRWLGSHGEEAVFQAIVAAEGKADPVAYIGGVLSNRAKNDPDAYLRANGIRDLDDDLPPRSGPPRRPPAQGAGSSHDLSRMFASPEKEARHLPEREVVH